MHDDLQIILWPDPRLKKMSKPVEKFDAGLRSLVAKMFELMRAARGVGLAAPQVGHNLRLFVINPTGKPEDDRVYVNPDLFDLDGEEEAEEGCLSIPQLSVNVVRGTSAKIRARDADGKPFEETDTGYRPRIWQHEFDHLNGTLLIDRMGPTAKLANRKLLKDLEAQYAAAHGARQKPDKKKM